MSENRPRRVTSLRVRILVTLAAPVVGLLFLEGLLRFLLFHDSASDLGASLRDARRYAAPRTASEEDYWKLHLVLADPEERWIPHPTHPVLGWLRDDVDPITYAHVDEANLGARRPVLLLGSSFVRCAPPIETSHQELLEESTFADRFRLLNYSVTAYGFGQVSLLLSEVLAHHRDADPVVVVAIQVDQDFDRMGQGFRQGPKPRFRLAADGQVAIEPPDELDALAYLERHPIGIRSYAWNHLVYGTSLVPQSLRDLLEERNLLEAEKRLLARRMLTRLATALDDTEYFVLFLFERWSVPDGPRTNWRHHHLPAEANAQGVPSISLRPMLRAAAEERPLADFYLPDGHPSPLGVALIQSAIERGLVGDFDS